MKNVTVRQQQFSDYIKRLEQLDTKLVRRIVKSIERKSFVQKIVQQNPNRRIYAVAKPTKNELVERAIYVIDNLDKQLLVAIIPALNTSLLIGEFVQRVFDLYNKGEISGDVLRILAGETIYKEVLADNDGQ
jgi:DNA-binding MarR family transcriptional regulator